MSEDDEICANCRHYEPSPHSEYGYCHRFPPVLVMDPVREYRDDPDEEETVKPASWDHPAVSDCDWCGEFTKDEE